MKKKKQPEKYDAWAVVCPKHIGTKTFMVKKDAESYREVLNEENTCKHKIVKYLIIL